VPSHTSSEHPWFEESRRSRDNPKADWYVWADAKEDGTPPNNWLSIFGGPAWQWEPRRRQYYLHNFLAVQPDLNFHHEGVADAVLENLRFWLDRGVDGFRLDSINFCFHDHLLRDNPAKPADQRVGRGFSPDSPYAYQRHQFNNTRPENLAFLARLRRLLDGYPDRVALGEVSSEDSLATMAEALRLAVALVQHVTPTASEKINAVLGYKPGAIWRDELNWGSRLTGTKVAESLVLFPRPQPPAKS